MGCPNSGKQQEGSTPEHIHQNHLSRSLMHLRDLLQDHLQFLRQAFLIVLLRRRNRAPLQLRLLMIPQPKVLLVLSWQTCERPRQFLRSQISQKVPRLCLVQNGLQRLGIAKCPLRLLPVHGHLRRLLHLLLQSHRRYQQHPLLLLPPLHHHRKRHHLLLPQLPHHQQLRLVHQHRDRGPLPLLCLHLLRKMVFKQRRPL